jgi:hypothetical protein
MGAGSQPALKKHNDFGWRRYRGAIYCAAANRRIASSGGRRSHAAMAWRVIELGRVKELALRLCDCPEHSPVTDYLVA